MKRPVQGLRNAPECDFRTRAEGIFRTYPELLSFTLEAPGQGAGDERRSFDIHVGLATLVTEEFEEQVCDALHAFVAEAVGEDPQALERLLGRTIARTLH